jgi:hypothetical protein
MNVNCEELLENIHKTLHECRDNKKKIAISGLFDIRECNNFTNWSKNIKNCIPLKIEIKNPIVENNYSIEYIVNQRSLVIS